MTRGTESQRAVILNFVRFSLALTVIEAAASEMKEERFASKKNPKSKSKAKPKRKRPREKELTGVAAVVRTLKTARIPADEIFSATTEEIENVSWTQYPISPKIWKKFKRTEKTQDGQTRRQKSPFRSVYECQRFFGCENANNIAVRFDRMVDDPKSSLDADYDYRINSWGRYAKELVDENGGWNSFLRALENREVREPDPHDPAARTGKYHQVVWPKDGTARFIEIGGPAPASFISRILALVDDRYIQVLCSPVGVLWPLWMLKQPRNWQYLTAVKNIGPELGGRPLMLELNTYAGQMKALPYPFGAADEALQEHLKRGDAGESTTAAFEKYEGEPWPPAAVNLVAQEFMRHKWSPPVLFGGRGRQWIDMPRVEELLAVGEPNNFLNSVFVTNDIKDNFIECGKIENLWARDNVAVDVEEESQAYGVVLSREQPAPGKDKVRVFKWNVRPRSRTEMCVDFSHLDDPPDIVVSLFPNDLLIKTNGSYTRLEAEKTFQVFGDRLILGRTALGGRRSLVDQPEMKRLLGDLGRLIGKAAALFDYLIPEEHAKAITTRIREIRDRDHESRENLVPSLREFLRTAQPGSMRSQQESECPIAERIAKDVMDAMVDVLVNQKIVKQPEEFKKAAEEFGWAILLEYVWRTWVGMSVECL